MSDGKRESNPRPPGPVRTTVAPRRSGGLGVVVARAAHRAVAAAVPASIAALLAATLAATAAAAATASATTATTPAARAFSARSTSLA